MDAKETMGRRIARLRIERGMTQEKLAREMGVSAQAVSKWEHDQNYPDISLLVPLATFLGATTDELLGASTTPSKTAPAKPAEEEKEEAQAESAPEEASSEEDPQHVEVQAVPKKHKHPISLILSGRDKVEDSERKTSGKGPKTMHIQCIDGDDSDEVVNLNIPLSLAKGFLKSGISSISGLEGLGVDLSSAASSMDFSEAGTLVDVEDGGDRVRIWVD